MADLTLRRVKGAPLTHNELDDNFLSLESGLLHIDSAAPTNPQDGAMWLNTTVDLIYVWDGEYWFQQPVR